MTRYLGTTLSFEILEIVPGATKVAILAHTTKDPEPQEWARYIAAISEDAHVIDGYLVITDGGAPNIRQRAMLRDVWMEHNRVPPPATAVVTESALVRGVITALAWIGGDYIRAFAAEDMERAMDYIGVHLGRRGEVMYRANYLLHAPR